MYYRGEELATVVHRMLAGLHLEVQVGRDRKLEAAR
jgi:hypothetical protein